MHSWAFLFGRMIQRVGGFRYGTNDEKDVALQAAKVDGVSLSGTSTSFGRTSRCSGLNIFMYARR